MPARLSKNAVVMRVLLDSNVSYPEVFRIISEIEQAAHDSFPILLPFSLAEHHL